MSARRRRRPSGRSSRSGCPGRTARSSCRRARPARSGCAAGCSTAPASRCPTRWSRPGRPTRTAASTTPTTRAARRRRAVPGFRGFGRSRDASTGEYARAHRQARPAPTATAQAPHLDVSVFARGLLDRVVTRIYFADEEANAGDPVLAALPDDAARARCSPSRRRTATASTSSCRAPVRPSSSPSDGGLFDARPGPRARSPARSDDAAWLRALLDVEAALARAGAAAGLVPPDAAERDRPGLRRPDATTSRARRGPRAASGNPVVPLVRAARARPGRRRRPLRAPRRHQPGRPRHRDDARRAAGAAPLLEADLAGAAAAAAALAAAHRDDAAGRPHAAPAGRARRRSGSRRPAGWPGSTAPSTGWRRCAARLPVQLGGAVGTLSALQAPAGWRSGAALAARARAGRAGAPLAHRCGCRSPTSPARWARAAGRAAARSRATSCCSPRPRWRRSREGVAGRGGSSTMPHKRNPVAAVSARAGGAAGARPGRDAARRDGAGARAGRRRLARRVADAVGPAAVHRQRRGLAARRAGAPRGRRRPGCAAAIGTDLGAEAVAGALAGSLGRSAAHDLVARAAATGDLRTALLADPAVRRCRPPGSTRCSTRAAHVGQAADLVDLALAAHDRRHP